MTHALRGLLLLAISISCYADNTDECANANPYLQQTCENLRQSATQTQKTRDEENEQNIAKHEESVRASIDQEKKPSVKPAPPPLPQWQQALKPPAPAQEKSNTENTQSNESASNTAPPVTPLPPLAPTEFAGPKAVTLPGGVNVLPIKPDKGETPKSAIKYY